MKKILFPVLVGSVTFISVLIALYVFFPHGPQNSSPQTANALKNWNAEIQTLGPAKAYQELLTLASGATNSIQHLNGHLFGSALYDSKGLAGFSACGMELSGGCLHEFVGRAIRDSGVAIVSKLSDDCIERFGLVGATACQHGIGHGLVADLGYKESQLAEALDECAKLPAARPERACYGGAFMEFNQRTMADNLQRTFDPASPFALCANVDAAYRSACYFWTPTWLMESVYGMKRNADVYAGAGAYCEKAPAPYADSCFEGLGYFAPPSTNFNAAQTSALCNAVSRTQTYRDDCWNVAKEAVGADAAPQE